MDLKLYDTLTRETRVFAPLDPKRVRMYVCGPTVYDFAHIGNARPVIVFDVLFRLLRHLYGAAHVTYVRNITDVDDKINARAAESGISIRELTETTYANFHADVAALGCLAPTIEPRATEHIEEMKVLIERLIAGGHAYVAEEHVLFAVASMPDYGKLSRRSLDELVAGARVDVAPYKRGEMDFVLWKPSKAGEPGWPSPAGIKTPGRPGWHIECSAMSWRHLGEIFDIHGGGIDLVFPHHENEIAQSRCAFHTGAMANYWMHNGFLQVESEKMSKSLGNFITIRELLSTTNFGGRAWEGSVLRLTMLMTHYRLPIDWTVSALQEAQHVLNDWKRLTASVDVVGVPIRPSRDVAAFLLNDLRTSDALHVIHEIARAAQKSPERRADLYANLVFLGLLPDQLALSEPRANQLRSKFDLPDHLDAQTFSVHFPKIEGDLKTYFADLPPSANSTGTISTIVRLLTDAYVPIPFVDEWKKYNPNFISQEDKRHVEHSIGIEKLNEAIEKRLAARHRKDFTESDQIRDHLASIQIALKDTKEGTTWEVAR